MRWPFGPPHLTLKPSKKKQNIKNKKKQKNNKKKKHQERKSKKHKNTKKRAFQLSIKIFFFDRVSKNCLFWHLGPENAHPKHYKNRGFSLFLEKKKLCVTKRPFLDKKTQIQKFQLSFFSCLFSLSKTKNTKICWNPYFYSVLANLKKENFPKINLKHRNLKNPFFAPFFWKRLFLDNCQIIGHKKKHKMITVCAKNRLKPLFS